MSNLMQTAILRRGMGALGADGPWVDPAWSDFNLGIPPAVPTYSASGFNWNNLTNVVGSTLSTIFGNRNNSAAQLSLMQQQQALMAAQAAARNSGSNATDGDDSDGGGGLGVKFTDKGLRLGQQTTIGYGTLLGGVALLLLIQSPGFTSRKR
jgi:hypothetical protein